jgi:arylsulfatase
MHFRTHVKRSTEASARDEYSDGMVEHDPCGWNFLKLIDDLGIANDTIVFYSTDNGPHHNAWPDAGTTPFRGEKNSTGKALMRTGLHPLARQIHGQQDRQRSGSAWWMVTFLTAASMPDVRDG